MARAVLLSQGNEITSGQTVDTNSAWLADRLFALGVEVRRVLGAPDALDEIVQVITEAASLGRFVVSTGGLGPTRDDLTAEALARATGDVLQMNQDALAQVEERYRSRGRTMAESNRKQALLPSRARVLENRWGTAPGFHVEHQGCDLFFLPGVPREMKPMFDLHIEPFVRQALEGPRPVRHIIRTVGVPESVLEELLREVRGPDFEVGFRARMPEVQVKLQFVGGVDEERRRAILDDVVARIGRGVFGVDSGELEEVVGELLAARGATVALAESCTAGMLASWLANVPGSSRYLLEGAVVYSNESKTRACGVPPELIDAHGAVSEEVARALAEGIRERAQSTYGVAITGIAGPEGGTAEKPVGTVHIAVTDGARTTHRALRFPFGREDNRRASAAAALELLRRRLVDPRGEPA